MIKSLMIFLLSMFIVLISFASGWIEVHCDGSKWMNDMNHLKTPDNEITGYETTDEKDELMNDNLPGGRYRLIKHILRDGETLYDLQRNYGTDWHIIQRLNKINDVRHLRPGQIIYVPVKEELG